MARTNPCIFCPIHVISIVGFLIFKILLRKRNVSAFKSTRQWLMVLLFSVIIVLLVINFFVPYTSIYKNLQPASKVREKKAGETLLLPVPIGRHAIDEEHSNYQNEHCEVIHIGLVCSGAKSNVQLHTMLKSIYFYRVNPLHFHIITNKASETVLKTLFLTWEIPQTNVTFYDTNSLILDVRWVPNAHYSGVYGLMKLLFPKIIPLNVTDKIIVLDTDLTVMADILELWDLFKNFNNNQAVGIVENQSNYYLGEKCWPALGRGFNSGVLLYYLDRLKRLDWPKLWSNIAKKSATIYGATRLGDQDIMNAVLVQHPELLYEVPCYWNTQLSDRTLSHMYCYNRFRVKVVHWNSPKKTQVVNMDGDYFRSLHTSFVEYNGNLLKRQLHLCDTTWRLSTETPVDVCSEFHKTLSGNWRTLLFFRDYRYTASEYDVTFLAHLSFDRLQMVEELVMFWHGPISLTLYVTDPEFQLCNSFIDNSELLLDRTNIAYHAVFKDGENYPINILRNVGLQNVNTPYVFLMDIDFLPMRNLYETLTVYLSNNSNMKLKALIIPAFESQRYRSRIPKNKIQLLGMLEKRTVFPFRYDVWAPGHSPTNYSRWRTATTPYTVKWEPDFEPYVVVRSDVVEYDNRFVGFGWNKVSHIMELEAQGYEFIVLPNAFIIHKPHAPSYDIAKFRTSPSYRMCLQNIKEEFVQKLFKKYGRVFDNRNASFTLPITK